ncbi:hypothetical protein FMM05_01135 [Flavobacterium zepuense]|uniref:YhhN-like protein n=1 Tax=Flavobacterium zepuense TaxID=2593302 RepID=A0A552V9X4_9FLAO|nr:hypothetical protein [Flavobacterium zepuense]TRW27272.1 hypothetical protein FMM05_01135 [Flavobacterium zepuense]
MTFFRAVSLATALVPILLFVGIAAGAYRFKSLKKQYRFLLLYLGICFLTDISSRIFGEIYNNNLVFIVIFSLLELLFFTVFYQVCLFKKKDMPSIILTIAATLYISWEVYILANATPKEFQSYAKVICSFIIIMMSITLFFEKIDSEQQDNSILKLNSAFVIYFSLNLILFLPINFLINVASMVKYYFWFANFLLTLLFYAFLSREIWRNGSTRKQLQSGS